ncbi:MAG: Plug domain-containing protein [Acidobacteriota bacterium]
MTSAKRFFTFIVKCLLALLLLLPFLTTVQAQTKQLLSWKNYLNYLQNLPDSDLMQQIDSVEQIRKGLTFWLELHPQSAVRLPDAPEQPLDQGRIQSEISILSDTVETLLKQESLRPFELGVTEISVTSEMSPLSPIADSIDQNKIERHHDTSVTQAFEFLPGVAIDYKPSRNQSGIIIRGFDTRQVGLYLDNIPIYIPYDGYADMGRFLTSEVAEIQVAKGYSSPLLGPNGLGGAVNIVTRQPEKDRLLSPVGRFHSEYHPAYVRKNQFLSAGCGFQHTSRLPSQQPRPLYFQFYGAKIGIWCSPLYRRG